jgi:hypothetical protein
MLEQPLPMATCEDEVRVFPEVYWVFWPVSPHSDMVMLSWELFWQMV